MLKLFCEDLTATQIANISGISRITVNAYLKLIRTHIAKFLEESNPIQNLNGSFSSLQNTSSTPSFRNGTSLKKSLYGIFKYNDVIHTHKIGVEQDWIYDWIKGRIEPQPALVEKFHLDVYHGVADFNSLKLFRVNHPARGANKGKSQIDEIDLFWGLLKSRFVKFRGLNGNTLYLHVKETEFRYNYRNEDIFELLITIILKRPLHLSR